MEENEKSRMHLQSIKQLSSKTVTENKDTKKI